MENQLKEKLERASRNHSFNGIVNMFANEVLENNELYLKNQMGVLSS